MRVLTLDEVMAGAERASRRVAAWPEWKKALSYPNETRHKAPAKTEQR